MENSAKPSPACDCGGLIIDLRGNPGGIGAMAMGMAGYLVDKRDSGWAQCICAEATINFVINPRPGAFTGPVAILVDGVGIDLGDFRRRIEGSGPGARFRHSHRGGRAALGDRAPAQWRRLPVCRRRIISPKAENRSKAKG